MKKLLIASSLVISLLTVPMIGLAIAAIWLLVASPVIFGVLFVSSLTFLVLKSLVAAVAVLACATAIGTFAMWKTNAGTACKVNQAKATGQATPATP